MGEFLREVAAAAVANGIIFAAFITLQKKQAAKAAKSKGKGPK